MIVFNGDFVDRYVLLLIRLRIGNRRRSKLTSSGSWSIEVALTVFAYKWLYPNRVYLNRGNHETNGERKQPSSGPALTIDMNKVYGFEGEAKAKHGEQTYKLFADVFTARKSSRPLRSPFRSVSDEGTDVSPARYPSFSCPSSIIEIVCWLSARHSLPFRQKTIYGRSRRTSRFERWCHARRNLESREV